MKTEQDIKFIDHLRGVGNILRSKTQDELKKDSNKNNENSIQNKLTNENIDR